MSQTRNHISRRKTKLRSPDCRPLLIAQPVGKGYGVWFWGRGEAAEDV